LDFVNDGLISIHQFLEMTWVSYFISWFVTGLQDVIGVGINGGCDSCGGKYALFAGVETETVLTVI
jgi:hypothetical protein